ncbi:MAG: hypothetical protein LBN39_13615 [Planctomycetaceae bacterium]|nr:hypothetical protein [Planctomycetaceae bacterium]
MKHFTLLLILLFLSGCGNNIKLGGKVVFPDGQPLETGIIYFAAPDFFARAAIRPDGTYDVGSLSAKDGLPPGKYKVYIYGAIQSSGKKNVKQTIVGDDGKSKTVEAEEDIFSPLIAGKFTSIDTTPLEVEVPGENVYNITVERP